MPAAPSRDTKDSNSAGSGPANGNGDGPRRSSLVQERSRRTRQELVNAAVKLRRGKAGAQPASPLH